MPRVKTLLYILLLIGYGTVAALLGTLVGLVRRGASRLTFAVVLLSMSAANRLEVLLARARSFR